MKTFSLVTHKLDSNVVETVEVVEKLKITKKFLEKISKFDVRTLKAVIAEIECNSDIDEKPIYQGQRIKYY